MRRLNHDNVKKEKKDRKQKQGGAVPKPPPNGIGENFVLRGVRAAPWVFATDVLSAFSFGILFSIVIFTNFSYAAVRS